MRKKTRGFTLVELIIVIIILGILAALAIPQFFDSTKDAQKATTQANLATIRSQIQLYYHVHSSTYPGVTDPGANSTGSGGDEATFVDQLTKYTDKTGAVSVDKDPAFPFGPYLTNGMPDCTYSSGATQNTVVVDIVTKSPIKGTGAVDGSGWKFATETGEFVANQANDQADEW